MARVFVYGTLKRGQPNHDVLLDGANGRAAFQGQGRTVEPYPLVIAGEHNVPHLLNLPGQGHCVEGEVYTVDERMLRFLDDFEGCPTAYQRTEVRVRVAVLGRDGAPSAPPGPPSSPPGPPSAPPGPPSSPPGPPSAPPGPPAADGTRTLRCFVYSAATYPPEWLQLPHHPSYDSLGKHGLRYHPRESR